MELLEARAKRLKRDRDDTGRPSSRDGDEITYTDDLSVLGMGRG